MRKRILYLLLSCSLLGSLLAGTAASAEEQPEVSITLTEDGTLGSEYAVLRGSVTVSSEDRYFTFLQLNGADGTLATAGGNADPIVLLDEGTAFSVYLKASSESALSQTPGVSVLANGLYRIRSVEESGLSITAADKLDGGYLSEVYTESSGKTFLLFYTFLNNATGTAQSGYIPVLNGSGTTPEHYTKGSKNYEFRIDGVYVLSDADASLIEGTWQMDEEAASYRRLDTYTFDAPRTGFGLLRSRAEITDASLSANGYSYTYGQAGADMPYQAGELSVNGTSGTTLFFTLTGSDTLQLLYKAVSWQGLSVNVQPESVFSSELAAFAEPDLVTEARADYTAAASFSASGLRYVDRSEAAEASALESLLSDTDTPAEDSTETASDKQTVYDSSDKTLVAALQTALNNAGYACGDADGLIGTKTYQAMEAYQTANGLTVTREITAELLDALGVTHE